MLYSRRLKVFSLNENPSYKNPLTSKTKFLVAGEIFFGWLFFNVVCFVFLHCNAFISDLIF